MRNLQEIRDFGANAAEYDALLERCFQEHPIFGKVLYDQRRAGQSEFHSFIFDKPCVDRCG